MNAWVLVRVHRGAAAVLGLLVFSACLLVAAVPKATQSSYDEALRDVIATSSASRSDLIMTSARQAGPDGPVTRESLLAMEQSLRAGLPADLLPVVTPLGSGTSHYGLSKPNNSIMSVDGEARIHQALDLSWLSDADGRVRYVAGRPPGPPSRLDGGPLLEVALARRAAEEMRLAVGATILLTGEKLAARVSGLFEPADAGDRYWQHNAAVRQVMKIRPPRSDVDIWHATGLVSTESLPVLGPLYQNMSYRWVIGVDRSAVTALGAPALIEAVRAFRGAVPVAVTGSSRAALETAFDDLLTGYLARLRVAESLLLLVLGGLLAVAVGVIALAVRLLAERMHRSLALMRARGASLAGVAVTATAVTSTVAVPSALAGYALSYAVPGPLTAIVHLGPLSVVAAAALLAAGHAAAHRWPSLERRDDVTAARPSPRRITVEAVIVVVALAGVYLLRSRGLTTQVGERGPDPLLLLAPAGLTLAVALVVLRCYPFPLRLAVRLAARLRPAVPFLGLTLAARARPASALHALILLPALAVAVFGAVMSGGLAATQEAAAWQRVGAPARLDSDLLIGPEVVDRVRKVPGVRKVVPATRTSAAVGADRLTVTVLAVDVHAYRAILRDSPFALPDAPVLVSPELRGRGVIELPGTPPRELTPGGVVTGLARAYGTGPLILVPPGDSLPNTVLVEGDNLDGRRLLAAAGVPGALVTTLGDVRAEIARAPLTETIRRTFTVVTIAMAGYALAAVMIALVIGAADRNGALSRLRTLGLSEAQARRLTVLEISPIILLTAAAGLLLGLGLPAVLGPGVDLRAYTGDLAVDDYPTDLTMPILLAGGLAATAVLGAFLHAALGRRRSLGSAIRVGD
ncbi:putative ABC transport system permease protein [Streptosporangium album]|uniref:Putative ABC transport system permease protein n=1 Tax=Streptosporangium album TaxID=47479 RepID=A0A7W7S599_9ACTN|nr:FtsX-like permease family protein [Streptosporangium album]MBB4943777.1 putative ABC transport system permease protein [Streptosporangium album]